ncbi:MULTISPECIES: phosphonopyruvate decarboxylase [unclassified Ruminococcus]|uniref:phosphonopyruvate decarboxylase n=1 Tax=unclassified Ruminococcus TaxID=2608920 RepID=UPI00210DCB2C|nr:MULTISPECIES: phosphonopyruvate decarboxylase [unclassified Ruminococcus]MCQ4022553.1 phosphonopyruvate decarboxylase [Ruminococcus sp. zg-924]MCQ4114793.1 phosphonopyruvate decarboxylase [Ruminococcus sp. zg-921]
MLNQERFCGELNKNGVSFFTGVPDSYLNGFCNYILKNVPNDRNIIAANEGNAIGIASGHYFATEEIPLVYMQNSGIGNTVNPIASLVDENVYAVPMLLLIGWRGQPGTGDWAQHELQGEITTKLLEVMHIPYAVLEDDDDAAALAVRKAVEEARKSRKPYGLIAPKGVMAGEKGNNKDDIYPMSREQAIEVILDHMPKDTIYSATTGRATRELFFLRERRGEGKECDFLNVGSMGHASSVALGIAISKPERKVVCLDGDSAAMMHMGAMTMVSKIKAPNFIHVVLNNGAHESVGGQPSAGHLIDFTSIAAACGYATVGKAAENEYELIDALKQLQYSDKAGFIDVRIHKGLSGKLPPLDFSHREAIDNLINELNRKEDK